MAEQESGQEKQVAAQKTPATQRETQVPKPEELTKTVQLFVEALVEAIRAEVTKTTEPTGSPGKNIVTVDEGFSARDTYTSKASEITRQLGLAGIAVVWVFKIGQGAEYSVPGELIPPALMLITGLTLDLLHYVAGAALWQWYTKAAQSAGKKEFAAPSWINIVTWTLFIAKIVAIVTAYIYLIVYLTEKILK